MRLRRESKKQGGIGGRREGKAKAKRRVGKKTTLSKITEGAAQNETSWEKRA
jgi:hypothetical protein